MSRLVARGLPWLAAFSLACASASSLPDFTQPTAEVLGAGDYRPEDVIPYRSLVREDFLASAPPPRVAANAGMLGAYTCANIVPDADQQIQTIQDGPARYRVRLTRFHFRAEMERSCSWWNAQSVGLPEAYVLEHEQVHFAIVEVSARRLTAEVQGLEGRGRSPEAAMRDLQQRLDESMLAAARAVGEESARFDRDTSGRYAPGPQAGWLHRVESEIAGEPR